MTQQKQWKQNSQKLQMLFFIFLVSMCTNSQIFAQNSTKSIEQIISGTTKDEKGDIFRLHQN